MCVVVWITGNDIGADGAKAIGWSLAFTPQLTCLDLICQWREGDISNGWCVIGYWGGHDGWGGHWGKSGTDLLRGGLSSVLLSHWELSVDVCELLSHNMGLCVLGVSTRPHCLS